MIKEREKEYDRNVWNEKNAYLYKKEKIEVNH